MDIARTRAWVHLIAAAVDEHEELLTQLDSAIGDGDHGVNMNRGFARAATAVRELTAASVGEVLTCTGDALISGVGGAAGPLYGSAFRAMGEVLPAPSADTRQIGAALAAGLAGIQRLGAAQVGDKTMVDAFAPAVLNFLDTAGSGKGLPDAAAAAARGARDGAQDTVRLRAAKGRASYLGPRSIGHEDPGAASSRLVFEALARAVSGSEG